MKVQTIKIQEGKVLVSNLEKPEATKYSDRPEIINVLLEQANKTFESSFVEADVATLCRAIDDKRFPMGECWDALNFKFDGYYQAPTGLEMEVNSLGLAVVSYSPKEPTAPEDTKSHKCPKYAQIICDCKEGICWQQNRVNGWELEAKLKLAFNAGIACNDLHPDDDSYDKVHFERVLKEIIKGENIIVASNVKTEVEYCEKKCGRDACVVKCAYPKVIHVADEKKPNVKEMIEYYEGKLWEIKGHYVNTQSTDRNRIDFKKVSNRDIERRELIEDFIADLRRLTGEIK